MSLGLQLLRAVIDSGARSAVRDLTPDLFTADELPVYNRFAEFYRRYGGIPSVAMLQQNGILLPPAPGPFAYCLDMVRERQTYNIFQQGLPQLAELLTNRRTAEARQMVAELARAANVINSRSEISNIALTAQQVMEDYDLARQTPMGTVRGVPTGYGPVDYHTAGMFGGDVITVAARPNVGKSWKLIKAAISAWLAGYSVNFVTMEMTDLQTVRRLIGMLAGVNPELIRRGRMSMHGEQILHDTIEGIGNLPPFHVMAGSLRKSTTDIDRMMQEFTPDLMVVDASYLVSPEKKTRRDGSRWEQFYQVGEELKAIAMDRNRPILQSVQLNRGKKKGEEFDLDQIAGGDVVGQISTAVVMLDRVPDEEIDARFKRRCSMQKNRDGELIDYMIRFSMSPRPDLSVLGVLDWEGNLRPWAPPNEGADDALVPDADNPADPGISDEDQLEFGQ